MLFFRWSARSEREDKARRAAARPARSSPTAGSTDSDILTFDRVQQAFEAHPPPEVEQPHP